MKEPYLKKIFILLKRVKVFLANFFNFKAGQEFILFQANLMKNLMQFPDLQGYFSITTKKHTINYFFFLFFKFNPHELLIGLNLYDIALWTFFF